MLSLIFVGPSSFSLRGALISSSSSSSIIVCVLVAIYFVAIEYIFHVEFYPCTEG